MYNYSKFVFQYGKALNDSNVYAFLDGDNNSLIVSEKVGKFQNGNKTDYLLFELAIKDMQMKEYIYRKDEEYLKLNNIRPIVDNIGGMIKTCSGCGHIVLKENITSAKNDKCIYCDKYACKKCKKLYPMVELDDDRLCEKCRSQE